MTREDVGQNIRPTKRPIVSNKPFGSGTEQLHLNHDAHALQGGTNQYCVMEMLIPDDFRSVIEGYILIIPDSAGQITYTLVGGYGTVGELPNKHFETQLAASIPVTQVITKIPINNVITVLAKNDLLGITIRDGGVALDKNIYVFETVIIYR